MSHIGPPDDPRLSFDAAVDAYDDIRPGYPTEMFDALFALLPPEPIVVEAGPGTGQATRDLLAHGAAVHAIEISPRMAAKLRTNLPTRDLQVSVCDFESVEIAEGSVDAVFSATAYHWVSRRAQLDRPAAILRPGGMIAIADLIQVDSPVDRGFFAASQPVYERYGQGHKGPPAPKRSEVEPSIARALAGDHRFEDLRVLRYDWDQTYTSAEYRKLMLSYSTTQMMDPDDRQGLLDDMESFISKRFDGEVTRPLVVTLTTARLA